MGNKDIIISLMIIITSVTAIFIPLMLFYIIAIITIFAVCYLVYICAKNQVKREKRFWQFIISVVTFLLAVIIKGRISICFYYSSLSLFLWFILYNFILGYDRKEEKSDEGIEIEQSKDLIIQPNAGTIIHNNSENKNQEVIDKKLSIIEKQIRYIALSIMNREQTSMELYDGKVKKIIDEQINSSKIEIYKNIDSQLLSMKNEFESNNNRDIGSLQKELKSHINSIMNNYAEQDLKKLNKFLEDISTEKADNKKLREEVYKNINDFKTNYLIYVQKSIDETQEIVKRLGELSVTNFKIIKNKEIRLKFEEAFKVAENEIDIVSPWINNHVMYKTGVYNYIQNAIRTGVKVKILYGIGQNDRRYNDNSNSRKRGSEEIAQTLKKDFKLYGDVFRIKKGDTHSKILICDNKFAIIGSYNFLSFDGNYEQDKRDELAAVITDERTINNLRNQEFNF